MPSVGQQQRLKLSGGGLGGWKPLLIGLPNEVDVDRVTNLGTGMGVSPAAD